MKLILKSLQTEMHDSFGNMSLRIDNLETNVNERIDKILLSLDSHIKETNYNFRRVDGRFDEMDRRFNEMDRRFNDMGQYIGEVVIAINSYSSNIENMLANHEARITALEKRH